MKILSTLSALLICSSLQAQTDTLTVYFDASWKPITTTAAAAFYSKSWQEGNKWHRQDFYLPAKTIQMDGRYADKETTIKDGDFKYYSADGKLIHVAGYSSDKADGPEIYYANKWH